MANIQVQHEIVNILMVNIQVKHENILGECSDGQYSGETSKYSDGEYSGET